MTTTPHWPSRRVGVGDGLTDFEANFASDASFASSWSDIGNQLAAEGADDNQVNLAKTAFVNSFTQLGSSLGVVDGDQALAAAKQFVGVGYTAVGAISTVAGLVSSAQGMAPAALLQGFTGTLISIAAATGAVSAGVGAAITLGVGAIIEGMQALGLGASPPGVTIPGCPAPTASYNPAPDLVVGCVGAYTSTPTINPGAPTWRTFPNSANAADAQWFAAAAQLPQVSGVGYAAIFTWMNLKVEYMGRASRAIDAAYPNYAIVAGDAGFGPPVSQAAVFAATGIQTGLPPILQPGSDFQKAFATAWQANAAYALNGLKPQPDEQVLLHALRFWNKSHVGPVIELAQSSSTYAGSLVQGALGSTSSQFDTTLVSADGTSLLVNSGGAANPKVIFTPIFASRDGNVAASTSTSTKVVAGVAVAGGAAVAASVVYAYATKTSLGGLYKGFWGSLKRLVKR